MKETQKTISAFRSLIESPTSYRIHYRRDTSKHWWREEGRSRRAYQVQQHLASSSHLGGIMYGRARVLWWQNNSPPSVTVKDVFCLALKWLLVLFTVLVWAYWAYCWFCWRVTKEAECGLPGCYSRRIQRQVRTTTNTYLELLVMVLVALCLFFVCVFFIDICSVIFFGLLYIIFN